MGVVIPAVLAHSRKSLEETLAKVDGLVDHVQIDIVDGRFVGPATWPYTEPAELKAIEEGAQFPYLGHFAFEVDLMIEQPEETIGTWINAGASKLLVHIESVRSMQKLIDCLANKYGHEKGFAPGLLSFGVAMNIDTDPKVLEPYMDAIDYVQFMGIATIGKQGQSFDTRVVRKIEAFRKAYPDMPVQVDGGISRSTAPGLLALGVKKLCIGSALFQSNDIPKELAALESLADEYGRYH